VGEPRCNPRYASEPSCLLGRSVLLFLRAAQCSATRALVQAFSINLNVRERLYILHVDGSQRKGVPTIFATSAVLLVPSFYQASKRSCESITLKLSGRLEMLTVDRT
jgi:hypothetical protein